MQHDQFETHRNVRFLAMDIDWSVNGEDIIARDRADMQKRIDSMRNINRVVEAIWPEWEARGEHAKVALSREASKARRDQIEVCEMLLRDEMKASH